MHQLQMKMKVPRAARLEALAAAIEAAKAQVHQVPRGRALKHGATA